jgi:hypothetical protein
LPDICGKVEHTKIFVSEPLLVNWFSLGCLLKLNSLI